uniref:Uncharacterized protein n=1 Tax=Anopheles melas TaxID=34690 RepID=A0A182TKG2_9DIPT
MGRERQNAGKKAFSAEHNQLLVLKLVEHIDDPCSEQERWENIAEEIMFETGENYPWRTVRMHYKQRIVSLLKEYTDDQRMIDRLQYPFLDRVYKLRVQYRVSALVLQDPAIIARNKLIIKYEIDPRFDADVVKVFKRYHTSSVQICINVQDPAYELSERWQKFLLKPTKSRHRLKMTMCDDLWFSRFPAYMNRTAREAPVAVTQQSSQESCSSSVILLDNVPVRIEMNDSPESVQGNGNVDKPIDANVPPRSTHASDGSVSTSEEPQESFYAMPDCVFDSTDSEDEDEDCVFDSTDSEQEDEDNTEHHSSGNDDRQTEPALPAAPLPNRIDITTLFQYEAALGPHLKRKKNVYDSIRSWMPLLFIKPTDSYVPSVSLFAKLALLQRIATDMNLILNPTVRVEDLMPIILRILCGARESQ